MSRLKPIAAMVWEQWQMTRVEIGQRLGLALVAGAGALALSDKGEIIAFAILLMVYSIVWLAIAKMSGGRLSDGYKPGFPLQLLYTRPVSTTAFVSVAVLYNAITITASYLLCAALLGFAFGKSLPLFSVTLLFFSWHIAYACVQWSTRSRVVQWVGSLVFSLPITFLMIDKLVWPLQLEFSIAENVAMLSLAAVSFVLTIVGVARQRRGDSGAGANPAAKTEWTGGFPDWLVTLFNFRCPTSSATRAQIWFELRCSGLPVMLIGLSIAVLIFLLSAISMLFVLPRVAVIPVSIVGSLLVLFGLGNNAFGIRRKQGRVYASPFEMTLPVATTQFAGLKMLVRVVCVLFAALVVGASLWISSAMVGDWFQTVLNNNGNPAVIEQVRQKFAGDFGALSGFAYAGLMLLMVIAIASIVAWQASREALRARNPRLLIAVQWLPAVWGLATMLLALAQRNDLITASVLRTFLSACFWTSGVVFLSAVVFFSWRGLAQGSLTFAFTGIGAAIAVAFGAAWFVSMPAAGFTGVLWGMLFIFALALLAPWSLSRVRHV